ncbi:MAG: hypothetical protein K8J31_28570 [Anaerolineae bacterium]|nr:hypothetical protein [Anaerolineae bacterium]
MAEQYDPKQIARLRQVLHQAQGLELLWLTGLEHVPWFETAARDQPLARLDQAAGSDRLEWLKNHLRQNRVEGDFLFRMNDFGSIPWARVRLDSHFVWLDAITADSNDLSFIAPNYTLRLDLRLTTTACEIYRWRHTPFDLDTDE